MVLFPRKKRYSKISYEVTENPIKKRLELIRLVNDEKKMIYKAAKKVRIKLATAKVILTNYRKTGRIFHRKEEDISNHEESA